jgi:hypothetical protein
MIGELFLSSFLGFLSALATEWTWQWLSNRQIAKAVLASLRAEAKTNLSALESHERSHYAFLGLFDSTAWSAAVSTNQLDAIRPRSAVEFAARMHRRLDTVEKWEGIRIQARTFGSPGTSVARDLDSVVAESRRLAKESIIHFLENTNE